MVCINNGGLNKPLKGLNNGLKQRNNLLKIVLVKIKLILK